MITIEQITKIRELRAQGLSHRKIASKLGISQSTVLSYLNPGYRKKRRQYCKEWNRVRGRLYRIWRDMRQRCYYRKSVSYKYYGAKGIKVCEEWRNSFEAFRNWAMANGYRDDLTIDRIDPEGDYTSENRHWITKSENIAKANSNRRNSWAKLTPDDVRWVRQMAGIVPQNEMARRFGVARSSIWQVISGKSYKWVK